MPGVLILAGPTASGKTDLAIALAQRFDAEIVSADSRQIYRGMPVGTAAPSDEQRGAIPHHLVGFLDPTERYSAARFACDALAAIAVIHARRKRAIVVGGTGFYIRALAGDVALSPHVDEAIRERLAREATVHPSAFLHGWLAQRDPDRAAALDPNDTYRVLRALEIVLGSDDARQETHSRSLRDAGIAFAKVFVDLPLEENDRRIAVRTDWMLRNGLLEEAERVGQDAVAASAVGYPQALAHLRGWLTFDELREGLARATRRYARRQRSWFKREPETRWLSAAALEDAARELLGWT